MFNLYFDQLKIARTTTREQWRVMDRWRRKTERQIADSTRKQIESLVAFGCTHPDMIDRLINPPILLNPFHE